MAAKSASVCCVSINHFTSSSMNSCTVFAQIRIVDFGRFSGVSRVIVDPLGRFATSFVVLQVNIRIFLLNSRLYIVFELAWHDDMTVTQKSPLFTHGPYRRFLVNLAHVPYLWAMRITFPPLIARIGMHWPQMSFRFNRISRCGINLKTAATRSRITSSPMLCILSAQTSVCIFMCV